MGRRIALSNGRRLVDDVIHMASRMPLASVSCEWDLPDIARLRRIVRPRISWNVLVMKAHAAACSQMPRFQSGYVKFPWPHLYQHHQNVCMMTISRKYMGEERLLFARFNEPDNLTLEELQEQYDHFRKAPVDEIKQFRHQVGFARWPGPVRRLAWWALFNVWPKKRAFHMGTFGMSVSGYKGAYGAYHLGPNTTTIGVDPMPRKGKSRIVLTFDHRVVDGVPATELLFRVRHILNTAIRVELAAMAGVRPNNLQPIEAKEAA